MRVARAVASGSMKDIDGHVEPLFLVLLLRHVGAHILRAFHAWQRYCGARPLLCKSVIVSWRDMWSAFAFPHRDVTVGQRYSSSLYERCKVISR